MCTRPRRNWENEFYKNGYPQEVIVIEDTPPSTVATHVSYHITSGPPAAFTRSKRRMDEDAQDPVTAKRRKLIPAIEKPLPVSHKPREDKDGYIIFQPHENLTQRYKMKQVLGQGTYGTVIRCLDRERQKDCAIKVIRALPKYREASKTEVKILELLARHDPHCHKCIQLVRKFVHGDHVCMVFDLLSQSLFDYLKRNDFRPFPPHHVQFIAKQLLTSVSFLHRLKIIHTDLKPENIMIIDNRSYDVIDSQDDESDPLPGRRLYHADIQLIDFGSATFQDGYHSSVVSTRHYRAPEVILGTGWSYPCDIWSVGCVLSELHTGEALFQTHDNLEHLAMMQMVLGPIPPSILQKSTSQIQTYFKNGRLLYPSKTTTAASRRLVFGLRELKNMILPNTRFHRLFLDLLQRMLVYDPQERITAADALAHPFFRTLFDEYGHVVSI